MSTTVRENILFSHEYDEEFYNTVLDGERMWMLISFSSFIHRSIACALRQDLNVLQDGDMTQVGEKGECCLQLCET